MVYIKRIENTYLPTAPHRTNEYILLWCTDGEMTLVVDDSTLSLYAHDVLTITSAQYHYFKNPDNAKGYILDFTLDYFCRNDGDIELIFQNALFCHFGQNEVIPVKNYSVLNEHLHLIHEELQQQPYQYLISVRSRIELILVEINRAKIARGDAVWKPEALFLKFLELVRGNFEHNYSLGIYADMLNTTKLKLNEQAKLHAGQTAQSVIYDLTISEARRLLKYENKSIKEVAFALGFNDPFYFSNFFKKHTNQSPKAYKASHQL